MNTEYVELQESSGPHGNPRKLYRLTPTVEGQERVWVSHTREGSWDPGTAIFSVTPEGQMDTGRDLYVLEGHVDHEVALRIWIGQAIHEGEDQPLTQTSPGAGQTGPYPHIHFEAWNRR